MKNFKERAVADPKNTEKLNNDLQGKVPRNDQKEKSLQLQGLDAGMFRRYSFDDNGGGYAGL